MVPARGRWRRQLQRRNSMHIIGMSTKPYWVMALTHDSTRDNLRLTDLVIPRASKQFDVLQVCILISRSRHVTGRTRWRIANSKIKNAKSNLCSTRTNLFVRYAWIVLYFHAIKLGLSFYGNGLLSWGDGCSRGIRRSEVVSLLNWALRYGKER